MPFEGIRQGETMVPMLISIIVCLLMTNVAAWRERSRAVQAGIFLARQLAYAEADRRVLLQIIDEESCQSDIELPFATHDGALS